MAKPKGMQVIYTGPGHYVEFRVVRHIRQWDGRTVGIIRNGNWGELVVQHVPTKNRWDVLSGVSATDIREVQP